MNETKTKEVYNQQNYQKYYSFSFPFCFEICKYILLFTRIYRRSSHYARITPFLSSARMIDITKSMIVISSI